MKLLFDENLSFRLCHRLSDLFPDSGQVTLLHLEASDDREIWAYAKAHGYTLVTQDSDFADMAALYGPPPKIIWLRCGNQRSPTIEAMLREHSEIILAFDRDANAACLELF